MTKTAPTAALVYGIAEGNWHGKRFIKALEQAGYVMIDDLQKANVLIAHSAGCALLHSTGINQRIILINPPYWPGKSVRRRAINKLLTDAKLFFTSLHPLYFFLKSMWNIIYALRYFERTRHIVHVTADYNLSLELAGKRATLLRNKQDSWCTSDLQLLKRKNPDLIIHLLPDDHDDCWLHPKRYIDLIQSDYRTPTF